MPLHPQARAVLERLDSGALPDLSSVPPELMRQGFAALLRESGEPEAVAKVENTVFPGPAGEIPVRVYRPEVAGKLPLLVYYHGGGFVICDLDTHDGVCRQLANRARCAVVSVDYRLAPEAKFPAGPEDCYAAARHAADHAAELGVDGRRIAVGGDSAGGNLAVVVALMARCRGGPSLRHQLLVYPVTNHDFETASYRENAEGYLLTRSMMQWFWGHYLEEPAAGEHPWASPLREPDLSGLPAATVLTAEYDPLRDEGEAFAERLRAAGVPTTLTRYDGMFHGFFGMSAAIDRAGDALDEAAAALRSAFA
jgi:acetyl esterase